MSRRETVLEDGTCGRSGSGVSGAALSSAQARLLIADKQ